ncbi:TAXI family TRAP transporter solute-binding subunit [Alkalilacustris brevis]|uniref:TAXI family TRAP transporter solute-binding subunit n=1 Tax=Alkalilacustris brevis TaxID=2026338 RepID=UPI000E0DB258|nr:TAXI family TRAP transporter solute-binding subunit [Alkalilacustris brevis]
MKFTATIMAAALGLAVAGGAQAETRDYLIGTGGSGGTFYPVGVGIATLVKLKLGTRQEEQVNMSAITSQGSFDNVNMIADGRVDFGIAQSLNTDWGYRGVGDFEGTGPKENLRAVGAIMFNTKMFIAPNELAPTGTMDDLFEMEGKRVVLGQQNSGGLLSFNEFLSNIGIDDPESFFQQSHVGFQQRAEAFINGTLDAINLTSGVPNAAATMAMAALEGRVTMLSFSPEMREQMTTGTVWGPYTIPAGTYPGQNAPVETIAQPNLLLVGDHVPEQDVYDITKVMYENVPFLTSVHGSFADMSIESAIGGITIPLHPGAARFYREQGLDIPDHLIAE